MRLIIIIPIVRVIVICIGVFISVFVTPSSITNNIVRVN